MAIGIGCCLPFGGWAPSKSLDEIIAGNGGTWWDLTQNTTIQDASISPNVSTWTKANCSVTSPPEWTYVEGTSSTAGVVPIISNYVIASPATFSATIHAVNRTHFRIRINSFSHWINITTASVISTDASEILNFSANPTGGIDVSLSAQSSGTLSPIIQIYQYSGATPTVGLVAGVISNALYTQRRASQLSPRSGSLGTLTQATAANQPFLWSGSAWSQTSGLRYYTDDHLSLTTAISQPYTRIFVADLETAGTSNYLASGIATGNRGGIYANGGVWNLDAGSAAATSIPVSASKQIITAQFNGSSSFVRANGVQSANVNPGSQSLTGLRIGADYAAANGWNGYIQDSIYLPGAVSLATIQKIENMLAVLRGITL